MKKNAEIGFELPLHKNYSKLFDFTRSLALRQGSLLIR
jgi:hypothetical protein